MPRLPLFVGLLLAVLMSAGAPHVTAAPTHRTSTSWPIEPFASYQPATRCSPHARPGAVTLGRWLVHHYGGGFGPISRSCAGGRATSEHNEGRAFDWMNDATTQAGRRRVQAFMRDALATDAQGNEAALARRMGIMYLIWDDHLYGAWNHFEPEPYLDSSCPSVRRCSKTLRHRDHLHISLTRQGGRGQTSWFLRRAASSRRSS